MRLAGLDPRPFRVTGAGILGILHGLNAGKMAASDGNKLVRELLLGDSVP
ncbi:MAG TPA: hypothetical protein VN877_04765 [Opitutaceae bacterium]|nr:hypothetical protein [Opitutaceae bacterium]